MTGVATLNNEPLQSSSRITCLSWFTQLTLPVYYRPLRPHASSHMSAMAPAKLVSGYGAQTYAGVRVLLPSSSSLTLRCWISMIAPAKLVSGYTQLKRSVVLTLLLDLLRRIKVRRGRGGKVNEKKGER